MLSKILVPLDGSPLSERILSQLRRLLVRQDAAVTLVSVVPPRSLETEKEPGTLVIEARKHLQSVAAPLREGGARVETQVLIGDAAERILSHSLEDPPSLIVMATHGRTGIQRWTRGSVAERVLRGAQAPILLANPLALDAATETRFKRILVPLDGSRESAQVLPLAREIAKLYGATLVLHFAVPVAMPVEGVASVMLSPADARAVLEPHKQACAGVAVEVTTGAGDPAASILDTVDATKCDLIAMTTHGRSGVSRWVFGSVAEHVARHAKCPLLVQRVVGAG